MAAGGPRPLTTPRTPQAVVEHTLALFGHLDGLVNHAGGSRPTAVDAPDAVWEESWTLTLHRGAPPHAGLPAGHAAAAVGPHH